MQCVLCGNEMKTEYYEGVLIDKCPNCAGVWLDYGELGPIIDRKTEKFSKEQLISALKEIGKDSSVAVKEKHCPKCSKVLKTFEYVVNSGVFLDRCPNMHGIWLDPGELEKVQIVMEEYERRFNRLWEKGEITEEAFGKKNCPVCGVELREIGYEGVPIDICYKCRGVWLDKGELAEIIRREKQFTPSDFTEIKAEEGKERVDKRELVTPIPCVICAEPMERFIYQETSGIVIDSCPRGHGVWLDKGELEKIQVFCERWEGKGDETAKKYSEILKKVREDYQAREEEFIKSLKPGNIGVINKIIQSLARLGFF